MAQSKQVKGASGTMVAAAALVWTAVILIGFMFWWPLILYSVHYWVK